VGAAILLVAPVACHAQTGTVHLSVLKAGFIVSTGGGTGTLDYQGRTYRLSVSSFGSGTIGVSGGELVGTAHNLRTAAEIAGTYKAAAAGLRSAPADRWHGFRMRTVSSSNLLEHRLA
jgi:hypothetical protein